VLLYSLSFLFFLFFFSSRRRHTRFSRDWSSDVCSSDLVAERDPDRQVQLVRKDGLFIRFAITVGIFVDQNLVIGRRARQILRIRSEERRVGKSVDLGGRRRIKKKKR